MSQIAKNRIKSAWTPLSNGETNNKYEKWTDEQRKRIIEDLVHVSKIKQLQHAQTLVNDKVPMKQEDFTRVLPKVLSVYLFSFLDPRSLCRASRVCWHWKFLTESDQLWMPKCLRLGWYLPFTPSPYETGVWKRNYIENIKSLQHDALLELERLKISQERALRSQKDKKKNPQPWRGSDPRLSYSMDAMNADRPQWARDDTSQNINVSFDKNVSKPRVKPGHPSPEQNMPKQPPSARSERSTKRDSFMAVDKEVVFILNVKPTEIGTGSTLRYNNVYTARLFPETPWKVPDSTDSD
ncbi:FBXO16 [Mytilus edulis]|uniref:FBXO16 n=1 Tax=Mytilus edulis TaxID=6550 RepID=A0A8S3RT86_MYTED|nr:FBXO16 [Mytilus edulis]